VAHDDELGGAYYIEEIKSAGVSTLRGICDCLNRSGISTRNGKNWYLATVRNILKIQNA